jgi:hypothetical protein
MLGGLLFVIAALAAPVAPKPVPPQPAPPIFATEIKGLTFHSPPGAIYCPLPDDWEGSDHGTILFLSPPTSCYGAGYPSSARGFEPGETPRIEVYYDYWMGDGVETRPPCHKVGVARLFSKSVPLCRDVDHGMVVVSVWSRYMADIEAEVSLTLITTPQREAADIRTFVATADTVRTCSAEWSDSDDKTKKKKPFVIGVGPRCSGTYF